MGPGAYLGEIAPIWQALKLRPCPNILHPKFVYSYYFRQEDYDYATDSSKILAYYSWKVGEFFCVFSQNPNFKPLKMSVG